MGKLIQGPAKIKFPILLRYQWTVFYLLFIPTSSNKKRETKK